jgi:hypothetical protein
MKKNTFPWISHALSGTGIGFPVTALCMLLIGGWNNVTREILVWMAASALFGIVSGLFFRKVNLHLLTATALHCVCCLGIASLAGWLCGYAASFLELVGSMIPVFALVYAAVYLSIFFAMKREAAQINKALEAE